METGFKPRSKDTGVIFTESRQRKGSFFNSFLFSKKGKKKKPRSWIASRKIKNKKRIPPPHVWNLAWKRKNKKEEEMDRSHRSSSSSLFPRNSSNSISLPLSLFSLLNFSHRKKKSIHRVYVNLSMFSSEAFLIHVNSTIITIHVPTLNRD